VNVAILGTGQVAQAIAPKLLNAGHLVVLGSRDPQHPPAWASEHTDLKVATQCDAISTSDIVINALPGAVAVDALTGLASELNGKVVMDLANAVTPSDDGIALVYPNRSLAEELARVLAGARVVKAMNTMSSSVMAEPTGLSAPSTVFVSGDDEDAKRVVTQLLADLGWPIDWILDLGPLATARGPEHVFQLLVPLFGLGTQRLNLAVIR
jgi:predicted dinucleotide-binding enzyme